MTNWLPALGISLLAVLPSTTNYQLNSYGFGSGGTANSTTTNYALEGVTGEASGSPQSTTNYTVNPGFNQTQQGAVPKISAFDNGGGVYYNKLHFTIDTQGNPSDALYALQISTDSTFATSISYVKSDFTISPSLAQADYQTYASLGSASGTNIIGLNPGVAYYLRAKVTTGKFTESSYGPSASATTANPSITFNIVTSSQSSPPYSIDLGSLTQDTVITSAQTINLSLTSNATAGTDLYINGKNGALTSPTVAGASIASATADLAAASSGYGAQNNLITQGSLGALTAIDPPYNGGGHNVGIIDATLRSIYTSSGPLTGANAKIQLKAKSQSTSVAASDYSDVLTLIAAGNF